VDVRCNATACIHNRQGRCGKDSIVIKFDSIHGLAKQATRCQDFQTHPCRKSDATKVVSAETG
jgi:hypothetical protein